MTKTESTSKTEQSTDSLKTQSTGSSTEQQNRPFSENSKNNYPFGRSFESSSGSYKVA